MIVTLTAHPAIDRLVCLDGPLERGAVLRTSASIDQPGGKGINVARVVQAAGVDVRAVVPAAPGDPILTSLAPTGLAVVQVPVAGATRVNLTLTEPDGTTTKLNAPGTPLDAREQDALVAALVDASRGASWVALCGSLPPGVPADLYARLVPRLRAVGATVAVDTSGAALAAALADPATAPDLVKPNGHELVELIGGDGDAIEADPELAAREAQRLRTERGPAEVLLTLGATGAVLATARGTWFCATPPVTPRSTVGAGDSSLAGLLLAREAGDDDATALATAVAHGSAAASLDGSTPPTPADVAALEPVRARRLDAVAHPTP
ncbi:MAG: 1-phosphofructokinase family hexose kinase [Propionibacteriales bacterium]|nr:1-phosphofructokinase family hexose kinase [Propionibacteriales bacterium]